MAKHCKKWGKLLTCIRNYFILAMVIFDHDEGNLISVCLILFVLLIIVLLVCQVSVTNHCSSYSRDFMQSCKEL